MSRSSPSTPEGEAPVSVSYSLSRLQRAANPSTRLHGALIGLFIIVHSLCNAVSDYSHWRSWVGAGLFVLLSMFIFGIPLLGVLWDLLSKPTLQQVKINTEVISFLHNGAWYGGALRDHGVRKCLFSVNGLQNGAGQWLFIPEAEISLVELKQRIDEAKRLWVEAPKEMTPDEGSVRLSFSLSRWQRLIGQPKSLVYLIWLIFLAIIPLVWLLDFLLYSKISVQSIVLVLVWFVLVIASAMFGPLLALYRSLFTDWYINTIAIGRDSVFFGCDSLASGLPRRSLTVSNGLLGTTTLRTSFGTSISVPDNVISRSELNDLIE